MPGTNLKPTAFFDYEDESVKQLFDQLTQSEPLALCQEIYLLVRDKFPYNPYMVKDGANSFKASYCAEMGEGYCIPKASLMIALCRKGGIPARLGLADVRNHLSTPKLDALLQSDVFSMHGYVEVLLNERWVKATPAFNNSLCEKYAIHPLEFDGQSDSIFHAYTKDGNKHMEYLNDYGTFDDVPVDFIFQKFRYHYPHLMDNLGQLELQRQESLESEVAVK